MQAHARSPIEVQERLDAERSGAPFLEYPDVSGRQQLVSLGEDTPRCTIGRAAECDIPFPWDHDISRLHSELELLAGSWTISDDGLSRNGTFVNGERVAGRRRLRDGDSIRLGNTLVMFRAPAERSDSTNVAIEVPWRLVSDAQRRVLVALRRPFREKSRYAMPATNRGIADELYLSVESVKTHLRALFQKFEVDELPQNQKRVKLVEYALQAARFP